MSSVEIISSLLGLCCVFLAGRGSKYNFYVGYLYNIFLFILCWKSNIFASAVLCAVSFAINVVGHYRWTHPREGERSAKDPSALKVRSLSAPRMSLCLLVVALLGVFWALVLRRYTADVSPWLDSFVIMLTFFAQYLSAGKHWECWIVWLVVNTANIVLYSVAGRYLMAATYALYFVNGVVSLIQWIKNYKNNV